MLLVIHDRGDRSVPFMSGAAVVDDWHDARLHSTDGLGHGRILADNDVVRVALSFIDQPQEKAS